MKVIFDIAFCKNSQTMHQVSVGLDKIMYYVYSSIDLEPLFCEVACVTR